MNKLDEEAIRFHTSGWMVRSEGTCDRERLDRFVRARGLTATPAELDAILEDAREEYLREDARLYACASEPCRKRLGIAFDALPGTRTGCQGICKQAPVAALRVRDRVQMFGHVTTEQDWRDVTTFAANAADAGSLLAPSARTERFWTDQAHDHDSPVLRAFDFLIGHFRGEGRFESGGPAFKKELVGTYEAGGRFLSLRMEARYPIPEGGSDVHRALVILGAEPVTGRIVGRSFTDGGSQNEYVIERENDAWSFDDFLPSHDGHVRKTLTPRRDGYDEALDVDGKGYCAVRMRHVACESAAE